MTARFSTLPAWLAWLEQAHPVKIDLELTRIREVARRMDLLTPPFTVITVGGTNGKGSSVAMLETILESHKVGAYTSPHVHRYNERIRIAGREADDAALIAAFAAIDAARREISLSYFEFSVLAALWLFHREAVEIAILEVGLGGRLDAVNILDADVALITAIDIDHVAWLGDTREKIAAEKAAIARRDRPAVIADPDPPGNLLPLLMDIGARPLLAGRDFHHARHGDHWRWRGMGEVWEDLPPPALAGEHQLQNAAGVIAVCHSLPEPFRCSRDVVAEALPRVSLAARFERLPGAWETILDVAHNPAGVRALADNLVAHPVSGRTCTLLGVMADKAIPEMIVALATVTDAWLLTAPDIDRAESPRRLADKLSDQLPRAEVSVFDTVPQAVAAARERLEPGDRLVVCGSFYTVGEARELLA